VYLFDFQMYILFVNLQFFPPKENLLIFDIDGTLTDSVPVHQTGFRNALKNSGITDYDNNFSGYKHHTDSFISIRQFLNPAINVFAQKQTL